MAADSKVAASAASVDASSVSAVTSAFSYRSKFVLCMAPDYQFHRVHYLEWGKSDSTKLMVCVHGLTRNAHDFDFLAHRMSTAHGYRVVSIDMPGRGLSDKLKNRANYDYKVYCSVATTVLAHVQSAGNAPRSVVWVGMSMGGLIGMMLSALMGPLCPIGKLVMVDIGPVLPLPALQHIAQYINVREKYTLEQCADALKARYGESWGPHVTDAHWRYLAPFSFVKESGAGGQYEWGFDAAIGEQVAESTKLVTADIDMRNLWGQITCPTLVLHGADSTILTAATCKHMANAGPQALVIDYPKTGHLPPLIAKDLADIEAWVVNGGADAKPAADTTASTTAAAAAAAPAK